MSKKRDDNLCRLSLSEIRVVSISKWLWHFSEMDEPVARHCNRLRTAELVALLVLRAALWQRPFQRVTALLCRLLFALLFLAASS